MTEGVDNLTNDLWRADRGMLRIVAEWMLEHGWTEPLDSAPRSDELVCLMVGWSASSNTKRGKALHELWAEWKREYEAAGGSHDPRAHPELSDARIRGLAARRDATVARMMGAIQDAGLIETTP